MSWSVERMSATGSDIGKGKELALAHINEGSDFLFPVADVAGLGVFQATVETAQVGWKDRLRFRRISRPERVVTYNYSRECRCYTSKVFVDLAKIVMEGAFEPQPYRFKMAEDEALTLHLQSCLKG